MKTYSGTVKVKDDSRYVYKGLTLPIMEVYIDYKNGKGMGVYADGTREYRLSIIGSYFEVKNHGTNCVIHDSELENIDLYETISLPFDKEESFAFGEFCKTNTAPSIEILFEDFIKASTKKSILPVPNMSTIYDDREFDRRYKKAHPDENN